MAYPASHELCLVISESVCSTQFLRVLEMGLCQYVFKGSSRLACGATKHAGKAKASPLSHRAASCHGRNDKAVWGASVCTADEWVAGYIAQLLPLCEGRVGDGAHVDAAQPDVQHEEIKITVIEVTDTRVEPRAVVVHLQDASASGAVLTTYQSARGGTVSAMRQQKDEHHACALLLDPHSSQGVSKLARR
jgi:hypothetical protein